ncbi:ferritin family protein [Paenibacillus sp. GCM10027626]|uniref:ferritin family protein n=1 Tax=Paenibacillus sp. GCM10027626 TaxID=3273411 RepID=UPI003625F9EC
MFYQYGYYPVIPQYWPMQQVQPLTRMEPESYKSLEEALKLIQEAVAGERHDEMFYDYLISVAPSAEDREIIESIRDDERKHNKMFRSIYRDITGKEISGAGNVAFEKPASYMAGIRQAFFGELAAVEKYRDIRAGLPSRYHRDMLYEIITDEQKHAAKYNYIMNADLRRQLKG